MYCSQENNYRLKDFCLVGDGTHTSIAREVDGVMYLTSKNFKSNGLDLSKLDFISEENFEKHFEKSKTALVKPVVGDIVFGIIGSIGTPYVVKRGDKFGISSSVGILRPGAEIDSHFLYYYMTSSSFQMAVDGMKSGSAQGFLSLEMIKNLPLLKLDIKIQRKISAILKTYDDLIESNKNRIALLERIAEEIYREWFVRFRFPNYQKTEFSKGVPNNWSLIKVHEAFKYFGGGTPSKDNNAFWKDGDQNWFTPSDITGSLGLYLTDSEDKPNEEGVARSSAKVFPPYSIMMTSRATIGAIGINRTEASTNQGFITCIPNDTYPLPYLYHWLKLSKNYFLSLCGGSTFPELNKSTFKKLEILTPPEAIMEKYIKLAQPTFDQIETLIVVNEKLSATKKSLLPRLISGKLSVEDLDIQFPPSMLEKNEVN
jgi:type I restriction enzyme S subunit